MRPGLRRQREIDFRLLGPIRAQAFGVVWAAAMAERGDATVLRVVDLHPWVAEPAEPLFEDGHWFMAVTAAADSVRAQWKAILSSQSDDLPSVFSPKDPKQGQPRMRFAFYDRARDEKAWTNAHEGVMHFARGCMMRIRNLHKYQPKGQSASPGLAIEALAALSRLARWITDAEVAYGLVIRHRATDMVCEALSRPVDGGSLQRDSHIVQSARFEPPRVFGRVSGETGAVQISLSASSCATCISSEGGGEVLRTSGGGERANDETPGRSVSGNERATSSNRVDTEAHRSENRPSPSSAVVSASEEKRPSASAAAVPARTSYSLNAVPNVWRSSALRSRYCA